MVKKYEITKDDSDEFIIKLNFKENIVLFIILIIALLIGYIYLSIYINNYGFYDREDQLKLFFLFLTSIIFIPLVIIFILLLLRSIFFEKILIIKKREQQVHLIKNYKILETKSKFSIDDIMNVHIQKNMGYTSYGLKLTNYILYIDLKSGKKMNVIGSIEDYELRKIKRLISKNINLNQAR